MPLTVQNMTGDGVVSNQINAAIEFPDSGSSVLIAGMVKPAGGAAVAISGSPLTAPAPPGSGTTVYIIQVNTTTGVASIKSQATTAPAPDTGNIVVSTQTLTPSSSDLALVQDVTPDTYLAGPTGPQAEAPAWMDPATGRPKPGFSAPLDHYRSPFSVAALAELNGMDQMNFLRAHDQAMAAYAALEQR